MARCAAFVLGSGDSDHAALTATIKTLARGHSGFTPDVFVGIDSATQESLEWLKVNSGVVTKGYTATQLVGWPILINTMLDQHLEFGEFDYDMVLVMQEGVELPTKGWLRRMIGEIEDDASGLVITLGGPDNPGEAVRSMQLDDGSWLMPRLWGGMITDVHLFNNWRCIPYQPMRGVAWLDDLTDHCTVSARMINLIPALQATVPSMEEGLLTDGGYNHAEA